MSLLTCALKWWKESFDLNWNWKISVFLNFIADLKNCNWVKTRSIQNTCLFLILKPESEIYQNFKLFECSHSATGGKFYTWPHSWLQSKGRHTNSTVGYLWALYIWYIWQIHEFQILTGVPSTRFLIVSMAIFQNLTKPEIYTLQISVISDKGYATYSAIT